MNVGLFLAVVSGVFWTVVYLDGIRIGIKDKSFAMPLWVLGLNFAWEFLNTILGYRVAGLDPQIIINGVWFLFDIGLVITYFRYGKKYFPKDLPTAWFYIWGILVMLVSFVIQYVFVLEFGMLMAAVYSAFLQNLLMSVLFIQMLIQRQSSEGQTMLIAVSKFLGSLAPTLSFGFLGSSPLGEPNKFVMVVGLFMAIFDVLYIWLLARQKRAEGV